MYKLTDYQQKLFKQLMEQEFAVVESAGQLTATVTVNKQSKQTESEKREKV